MTPGVGSSTPRAGASGLQITSLQSAGLQPVVGQAVFHDQSLPLSQLALQEAQLATGAEIAGQPSEEIPHPRMPKVSNSPSAGQAQAADGALQSRAASGSMPAPLANFEGINNINAVLPPDTQGDIGYDPVSGRKFYVQWVNLSFEIWDVTSTPTRVLGPLAGNTLWQGFGGACEQTNNGDVITLYDSLAQRWLMSQFSIRFSNQQRPHERLSALRRLAGRVLFDHQPVFEQGFLGGRRRFGFRS
jgi:hypothetical protein